MAADGTPAAKNAPQFIGGGAPSTAPDLNTVAVYASYVGNRKVDTAAARTTAAGLDVWEGLEWHDTTDGITYRYLSGGWKKWDSDWIVSTPTPEAGSGAFTTATAAFRYKYVSGSVQWNVIVAITTAGTAAGTLNIPLPFTALVGCVGVGFESVSTGVALTGYIVGGTTTLLISRYDAGTVIANSRNAVMSGMAVV